MSEQQMPPNPQIDLGSQKPVEPNQANQPMMNQPSASDTGAYVSLNESKKPKTKKIVAILLVIVVLGFGAFLIKSQLLSAKKSITVGEFTYTLQTKLPTEKVEIGGVEYLRITDPATNEVTVISATKGDEEGIDCTQGLKRLFDVNLEGVNRAVCTSEAEKIYIIKFEKDDKHPGIIIFNHGYATNPNEEIVKDLINSMTIK